MSAGKNLDVMVELQRISTVVDLIDEIRRDDPTVTIPDLVARLRDRANAIDSSIDMLTSTATCRNCDKPIVKRGNGPWFHQNEDFNRGCYAASFVARNGTDHGGWDRSLDRRSKAQPPKDWAGNE